MESVVAIDFHGCTWRTHRQGPLGFFRVAASENTGHKIQHVGRTFVVVAVVPDQPSFDDVDLLLRVLASTTLETRLVSLIESFWSSNSFSSSALYRRSFVL